MGGMLSCYMSGLFVHSVFHKTPAWPDVLDPFSLFPFPFESDVWGGGWRVITSLTLFFGMARYDSTPPPPQQNNIHVECLIQIDRHERCYIRHTLPLLTHRDSSHCPSPTETGHPISSSGIKGRKKSKKRERKKKKKARNKKRKENVCSMSLSQAPYRPYSHRIRDQCLVADFHALSGIPSESRLFEKASLSPCPSAQDGRTDPKRPPS